MYCDFLVMIEGRDFICSFRDFDWIIILYIFVSWFCWHYKVHVLELWRFKVFKFGTTFFYLCWELFSLRLSGPLNFEYVTYVIAYIYLALYNIPLSVDITFRSTINKTWLFYFVLFDCNVNLLISHFLF